MSAKTDFLRTIAVEAQRSEAGAPKASDDGMRDFASRSQADTEVKDFEPPAPNMPSPIPHLQPFADMDYWALVTPLRWTSELTLPPEVIVPRGFVTDFASIPSTFWSWMPRTGRYGLPAVIHDWLYWEQTVTRMEADDLFDAALGVLEVPIWQRFVICRSVRWFGGRYWDDNTAEKEQGLKRVIVRFPDDPRISWAEWRALPDVFAV
jgi:hypothetical protein